MSQNAGAPNLTTHERLYKSGALKNVLGVGCSRDPSIKALLKYFNRTVQIVYQSIYILTAGSIHPSLAGRIYTGSEEIGAIVYSRNQLLY
jgi:hypothetical protein